MRASFYLRACVLVLFSTVLASRAFGQTSEIGKWATSNVSGDSIVYEFTDDGRYIFELVGMRSMDLPGSSAATFTFYYRLNPDTSPMEIDFYDEEHHLISKGILEVTPTDRLKICVNSLSDERPTGFVQSATLICDRIAVTHTAHRP
ncbi:hypothetical protein SAMN05421823_103370 [Catalinimonas alkaloidigena]|uniref:DUF4488 domain-containing protein n=1 Tax=Catalinimonas alkaloidigena TaxID=1075417 RepID=A0A1G9E6X2_9BACT|nr:hypothetical protein [Catalinimonas alkaloidigena]SDK71892.1 hypothetical protein SAMN05421823_103370 [Catalinimonas alkaloidigena]